MPLTLRVSKWTLRRRRVSVNRSASLPEPRKRYTRTSINSLTDTSRYQVEVSPALPSSRTSSCGGSNLRSGPVQHLMTFVLDRKDGMISVDDGVRRLRLLDAKGKVWTQEMLLQVEERGVSLMDLETQVRLF